MALEDQLSPEVIQMLRQTLLGGSAPVALGTPTQLQGSMPEGPMPERPETPPEPSMLNKMGDFFTDKQGSWATRLAPALSAAFATLGNNPRLAEHGVGAIMAGHQARAEASNMQQLAGSLVDVNDSIQKNDIAGANEKLKGILAQVKAGKIALSGPGIGEIAKLQGAFAQRIGAKKQSSEALARFNDQLKSMGSNPDPMHVVQTITSAAIDGSLDSETLKAISPLFPALINKDNFATVSDGQGGVWMYNKASGQAQVLQGITPKMRNDSGLGNEADRAIAAALIANPAMRAKYKDVQGVMGGTQTDPMAAALVHTAITSGVAGQQASASAAKEMGTAAQKLTEPLGKDSSSYVSTLDLSNPHPSQTQGDVKAKGSPYVELAPQRAQAVSRASTVDQGIREYAQILSTRPDLFPPSTGNKTSDLAMLAKARGLWLAQDKTGMVWDPDVQRLRTLQITFPSAIKLFGDTGNIAVQERELTAKAAGLMPGMSRDAAEAALRTYHKLIDKSVRADVKGFKGFELPISFQQPAREVNVVGQPAAVFTDSAGRKWNR